MEELENIGGIGSDLIAAGKDLMITYGPKLIGAVIALIIGLWIIKWIVKLVRGVMKRGDVDESLRPFLTSLVSALLKVMLAISIMGMVGVEMTSFIAILGAAGLAVGMALSGTLQNFAGGVMILLFKPFKVGDLIEAQGYTGVVKEIQIFVTILTTVDNKTIIIPNGGLSNGSMINYSTQATRRVDWSFGIGYGDDLEKAKSLVQNLLESDSRILKDPATFVKLGEMADSSVNLTVRAWVNSADYWDVFFDTNEKVYATFNSEGITIPYPQMDVHVQNN
ncbi:MAG: mechanosensitive ion channel domain-containing protein [Bacteroidota bacterium]